MKLRNVFTSAILLLSFGQISFAGDTAHEVRKVSTFNLLKISGKFNIILTQGNDNALIVSGDKNAVAATASQNTGVALNITQKDTTTPANLYITFKDILQVSIVGNCKVSSTKEIKTDDLKLVLDGNAGGSLDVKTKVLTFNCTTDKNFTLSGKADKCTAKVEDDGAIDMSQFKVDDLTLEYASDTDIKIYAHPDLHVKMAGAGNLTYYGNPKVKVFTVNGTGNPTEGK